MNVLKFLSSKQFAEELIFVVIGVFIILLNYLYLGLIFPLFSPILNVVGALVAVVMPVYFLYARFRYQKEAEQQFILFIDDITDSLESGMTLPMAIDYAAKKEYGVLTGHIKQMVAQIDWGVPFRKALLLFGKKTRSTSIQRSITTIIETYSAGGKITTTLKSISESLLLIDNIRKERSASVHQQLLTSYIIFFIFIFILVVLQSFLIPALSSQTIPGLGTTSSPVSSELFTQSFINFIIVQGFFAGLVTGKLAEGSLTSGFKHSIVLIAVGYTVFSIFSQLQFTF